MSFAALSVQLANNPGCSEKIVAAKKPRSSVGLHPGGGAGGASAGAPGASPALAGCYRVETRTRQAADRGVGRLQATPAATA